jgi:hypothetical protein
MMSAMPVCARAWRALCVVFLLGSAVVVQAAGERLPVGEFTATRFVQAPTIDGVVAPGEWDRAFTTSGLVGAFDHELQESVTVMSLGFDAEKLYFLFQCTRGNYEWKLWKKARQNDDYSFGDSSVELWISPPTLVPEAYQNIFNLYPCVFDLKTIPTRGYTAQGWKGHWQVGVKENGTDYIVEAAIPIKDFGCDLIKNGDIWKFLMARTCHGAKPRAQASWSITQGFAEIPQYPPVHLMDDEAVLQLTGTHTILTGTYEFPITVVAPRATGAEVDVEVRFQHAMQPGDGDRLETRHLSVRAGERQTVTVAGDIAAWSTADAKGVKRGFFTVTGTKAGGTVLFRQYFPYAVSGWTPQKPVKPEKAGPVEELAVTTQYGPETETVLVNADIFDLPARARVASAEAQVVDPVTGKTLARRPMRPFTEWYSGAELKLTGVEIPVDDFRALTELNNQNRAIRVANQAAKDDAKKKKLPPPVSQTLLPIPHPAPKLVQVLVTLKDKDGKELASTSKELKLIRYAAEWMNHSVGITEKVIPPWTPVQVKGRDVSVWNRTLTVDGLGLAQQVVNGGEKQLAAPMRLVVVKDGAEIEVKGSDPSTQRRVDAEADLTGNATAAGLTFNATTRVEFDGFVNVNLNVAPAGGAPCKVEKLFLEITLPADKASHFCTTAGGWAAVHDTVPETWSSQSTASGMLVGDFVPYIWLTDSDTAFLWFADHDKGWNHDPDKALPTQEIRRQDGKVVLRINFFEIPTEVTARRTLTWGWQTFPSRPLPAGWRATFCNGASPVPHTKNTYFWSDADAAGTWAYYISPYPWSYEASKAQLGDPEKNPLHRPCVGSIAHSIARYMDYNWNDFKGLSVDWGDPPGHSGGNVTASKGPNDFRLWHYQKWVKDSGLRGLYVDENYLALEDNYLTGNAYWREDGRLQRAYNYVGLRDLYKRMKLMFHENGVREPNLWQHITSGAAYHAWFGDIFFEGENVEPTDLTFDYIEVLPAGRLRAVGSARCVGGVMTMMCQSIRHKTQWWEKHTHQFLGWVMAHDILPEQVPLYAHLAEAGHLWADDVTFRPYWKPSPFTTEQDGCLVSAHLADGRALLWVVNVNRKDAAVTVAIDWKAAGFDPGGLTALNAETGAPIVLGPGGFTVPVLQRDFVPVLFVPKRADGARFTASFDQGTEAEAAVYCTAVEPVRKAQGLPRVADGKGGHALSLAEGGVTVRSFLHLADAEGRIAWRALLAAKPNGALVSVGPLSVQLQPGKEPQVLLVLEPSAKKGADGATAGAALPAEGWHDFVLGWTAGTATLRIDGQPVATLAIRPLGLSTGDPGKLPPVQFVRHGNTLAVDDLRLYRTGE